MVLLRIYSDTSMENHLSLMLNPVDSLLQHSYTNLVVSEFPGLGLLNTNFFITNKVSMVACINSIEISCGHKKLQILIFFC